LKKNNCISLPAVSCIIPTYNDEATIERAVSSVLNCKGISEVIVIDDGSRSHDTSEIVSQIKATACIPLIYYRQDNAGPSSARNRGVKLATSDWVTFLDADDEMLPDSIVTKFTFLGSCESSGNIDAVYGSFINSDTGQPLRFSVEYANVNRDFVGRKGGFPGASYAYVFKKEVLNAIGGYCEDLRIMEDFDLILRLLKSDCRIVGTDMPGVIQHMRESSLSFSDKVLFRAPSRKFLKRAWTFGLMSRPEIARRFVLNIAGMCRDILFRRR